MAKTENSRSGINELYPPVGHVEAAPLVAAAASFLSANRCPKTYSPVTPYRNQKGVVSETCSPVDHVRGGRDGVTGGSSSKGTTVGVLVEQMQCDLIVAGRVRRHRTLI